MSDNKINGISNVHLEGKNSPMGISFGNDGFSINSVPCRVIIITL